MRAIGDSVFFLDSSALAKVYLDETESAWVRELFLSERTALGELAFVELNSAFGRLRCRGVLNDRAYHSFRLALQDDVRRGIDEGLVELVPLNSSVAAEAIRLMDRLTADNISIKSLDALQMASAALLPSPTFLSFDRRLNRAASLLGFRLHEGSLPSDN